MDGTKIRVRMYERDLQLLVCVKERGKLLGQRTNEKNQNEAPDFGIWTRQPSRLAPLFLDALK